MAPLIKHPQNFCQLKMEEALSLLDGIDDPHRAQEAKNLLRTLVHEMLDVTQPFVRQDPRQWAHFINKALDSYGCFRHFEGAWPVQSYVKRYLSDISYGIRSGKARGQTVCCRKAKEHIHPADNLSLDAHRTSAGVDPVSHGSGPSTSRQCALTKAVSSLSVPSSSRQPVALTETVSPLSPPSSSRQPVALIDPVSPLSPPSSRTTQSSSSDYKHTPSAKIGPLETFLCTACPLLASAAPAMVAAGIADEACFRELAEWPDKERDALLHDVVQLSPFQLGMSRVFLSKLRKRV